jgi:type IV secretion system protein VirB5
MLIRNTLLAAVCLAASLAVPRAARAQFAVIDVPALAQLVEEVQTTQQQLETAHNQLQSAQQALQAMTGDRGMQLLLSGIVRNYLPANWAQLNSLMQGQGGGGYAGLAADVLSAVAANAILSPQRLALLAPADQQLILAARQSSATQQALSHAALANASSRFASIQSLIAAISTAADQKAILDLQARISAELGMLQNEQTKVQVLYQAMQAQESVTREQAREQVIAGQGRFETRFRPAP